MARPVLMLGVLGCFESEALCYMYHCFVSCSGKRIWVITTVVEHVRFLEWLKMFIVDSRNAIKKYFRLHVGLQCCQKAQTGGAIRALFKLHE